MKQIDLFNIKLNHIRIFLSAVEFGSFSKAAAELCVTQPMVSKSIQTLENELELILFWREKGKLKLTPAGRELYVQWKNLLRFFENSIEDASALQEGVMSRIVIGIGYLTPPELQVTLAQAINRMEGNIKVHFESHPMTSAWEKLYNAQMDAILTSGHTLPEPRPIDLEWELMARTKLAVYVPFANPLSSKDNLSFSDFKEESFIAFSSDNDSRYLVLLNRLAEEAGFVPRIACYVPDEASFGINLRMNNGIVLADSHIGLEEMQCRKYVLENEENNLYLVWRSGQNKSELYLVKEAIRKAFDPGMESA